MIQGGILEFACTIQGCKNIKFPNFRWDARTVRPYATIFVGKLFKFDAVHTV